MLFEKTPWAQLSDEDWLNKLIASQSGLEQQLPSFPPSEVQSITVGCSGETAIREAFNFFLCTKKFVGQLPSRPKLLDFGVGWGRTLRTWMRDIPREGLFGVDVDPELIAIALSTNVPGRLQLIEPLGELPTEDKFDIIISFSVFSHLSEQSARHWLVRLSRALNRGAKLVITVLGLRFLERCIACYEKTERSVWEAKYAEFFKDPRQVRNDYQTGLFGYAGVGGHSAALTSENYGWAVMPIKFVEGAIGFDVDAIEYHVVPTLEQDVMVITR